MKVVTGLVNDGKYEEKNNLTQYVNGDWHNNFSWDERVKYLKG